MAAIDALLQLMGCHCVDGRSATHAMINEQDPSAKLKKLTLSDLRPGMLVLLIDEGRKVRMQGSRRVAQGGKFVIDCMSPLFQVSSTSDHNRACDAVLIVEDADAKCTVIYIDLKSDSPSGYKGQFQSTLCFMRYVKELLRELYGIEMQIVRERFVIYHTDSSNAQRSINKKTTHPRPENANNPQSPAKYIVRDGDTRRVTEIL